MQWCTFEITAKRSPPSRPSITHSSQSGRRRSSSCELEAADQALELGDVAGLGQGGVADVVLDAEVVVVDPDRPATQRCVGQALPVARDAVQARADERADPLDVDAAVLGAQRPGFGDEHRRDVHRRARPLGAEERRVLRREQLVLVARHPQSIHRTDASAAKRLRVLRTSSRTAGAALRAVRRPRARRGRAAWSSAGSARSRATRAGLRGTDSPRARSCPTRAAW